MSYYRICPKCGAYLDPGEICDCGQKESRPGEANTEGGKAEPAKTKPFRLYFTGAGKGSQG